MWSGGGGGVGLGSKRRIDVIFCFLVFLGGRDVLFSVMIGIFLYFCIFV